MRIAICEDNREHQIHLQKLLDKYDENDIQTNMFLSGEELIDAYEHQQLFDVILLDMQLDELDGIETGRIIRKYDKDCIIIIITSIIEYAVEGYGIGATDFILKPIDEEKFYRVMDGTFKRVKKVDKDCYCIQSRMKTVAIDISEIVYIESEGRNTIIHTLDDAYQNHESISTTEAELEGKGIIRISRYYLVNMKHIKEIAIKNVVLFNGMTLKYSSKMGNDIKNRFMEYMMEGML